MEIKGYHIISLEAKDIYEQELINGVEKGFVLPLKSDRQFFGLFKNVLDYSLDLIELEKCYYSKCKYQCFLRVGRGPLFFVRLLPRTPAWGLY